MATLRYGGRIHTEEGAEPAQRQSVEQANERAPEQMRINQIAFVVL